MLNNKHSDSNVEASKLFRVSLGQKPVPGN